ncbi:MAG: serine hydrolase [Sphingobacteriales bacterium]|nr:MAG: serine hydrolase [Sphingobacteriales bacterium]
MKRIFFSIFLFLTCISILYGQTRNDKKQWKRIKTYLSKIEKAGFNGAVLIALNNGQMLSEGYGFSNMETKTPNKPNTVFDIGSLTKQFTAAAILKLEMQGKLSTEDAITAYFNNIPADKEGITIHDLLRHQSGLVSNVGKDYEKITDDEFLQKVWSSELRFQAGTNFSYSNIGYSLLAMIIEKVSGQSYETCLYENLWKPANMEMTGYIRPKFDPNQIARGYDRNDADWGKPTDKAWGDTAPYRHLTGNGGILSTTEDLYKWHQALMSSKILSAEAKQKLYHPKLRNSESETSYYAYGWDVFKTCKNTLRVWHNGTNRIFYADFMRFIDEQITLISLSNKSHPVFDQLNFEISKMISNPNYDPEIPAADNPINRKFTAQIMETIEHHGLQKAKTAYLNKKKSEQLLEYQMRNEGFNHIDNGQPGIAIQIFELNVFAFPNSAKALQGLGEGFVETGNKTEGLQYLKKSLQLNPDNPFVATLIKDLEN